MQVWKAVHASGVQGAERQDVVCGRVVFPARARILCPLPSLLTSACTCGCCDAMWSTRPAHAVHIRTCEVITYFENCAAILDSLTEALKDTATNTAGI